MLKTGLREAQGRLNSRGGLRVDTTQYYELLSTTYYLLSVAMLAQGTACSSGSCPCVAPTLGVKKS